MPDRADEIELYSEEVQDILGTPPKWLVSWGTTVIFMVVGSMLFLSAWVKYPDIVSAPIMITTPNSPSPVVSRSAGRLDVLYIENGKMVNQGDILGIIENTAKAVDIFNLEKKLLEHKEFSPKNILNFIPQKNLQLGELSTIYAQFAERYEAYQTASLPKYDQQRIKQILEQINNFKAINTELEKQKNTLEKEETLAKTALDRQVALLEDSAAAKQDVENFEVIYLQKKRTRESVRLEILNNELRVNELNQQITNINKNIDLTASAQFVSLNESIKQLKAQIEQWKTAYVLTAPIGGEVALNSFIEEKTYIEQQFEVATIVPSYDKMIGLIALPMKGSGKVETGQKVIIKLDGFPFQEYGFVRGEIQEKAAIPRNDAFEVKAKLVNDLITNRGDTLKFEQRIQGVAEIITEKKSLLRRIFDQIASAFEQTVE